MYPLEIVIVLILLFLLITQNSRSIDRKASLILGTASIAIFLLIIVFGNLRWQMAPVYLLFVILTLLLIKKSYAHLAIRTVGVICGFLLIGVGVTLSMALPIVSLGAPDGPYAVGSRHFSLTDVSRDESFFGLPDVSRELSLRVWYPGILQEAQARPLWEDLYRGPKGPVPLLTGYMRGIKTNTYPDLPFSPEAAPYPVIIFSHALAFHAEQNTPLMEHLASHGYIVIGVNHSRMALRPLTSNGEVIPLDPNKLQEAFDEGAGLDNDVIAEHLEAAGSANERVEILHELAELTPGMNAQVAVREADLRFVMDIIATPPVDNRDFFDFISQADPESIGLVGMSVGGATVIDTCKVDLRCRAGLNLDGGVFGNHLHEPLKVPFLSMISEPNQMFGEALLLNSRNDYYEVLVGGAGHGDFSDMSFLMPFMKWVGANGPIPAERIIKVMNDVSLEFFDAYLRRSTRPQLDTLNMPDVQVLERLQEN